MAKKTYTELVSGLGRNEASDECYTPADQVLPLLKYLNKDMTYYEATSGKSSNILEGFHKHGYNMVGSGDTDFLDCTRSDIYDGVITNPPYSIKDKFIEHGMSALVYNNRVDFTGKGNPTFGNAWFIHGFLPPNTIYWVDNPKQTKKTFDINV